MIGAGAGFVHSQRQLSGAVAEAEAIRERGRAARDRSERRLHAAGVAALQVQVDQLRTYVATLFQLLVARGVFTADEATRLVSEFETAGESGAPIRDVVTGVELPPEVNPFTELVTAGAPPVRRWRVRLVRGVGLLALGLVGLWVCALVAALVVGLVGFWR